MDRLAPIPKKKKKKKKRRRSRSRRKKWVPMKRVVKSTEIFAVGEVVMGVAVSLPVVVIKSVAVVSVAVLMLLMSHASSRYLVSRVIGVDGRQNNGVDVFVRCQCRCRLRADTPASGHSRGRQMLVSMAIQETVAIIICLLIVMNSIIGLCGGARCGAWAGSNPNHNAMSVMVFIRRHADGGGR